MALDTGYCILDTKQKQEQASCLPSGAYLHFRSYGKRQITIRLSFSNKGNIELTYPLVSKQRCENSRVSRVTSSINFENTQHMAVQASARKQLECPWRHRVEGLSWAQPGIARAACFSAALSCNYCKFMNT